LFVAWVVFHVIICISLVLVVLLQSSKGEGLAGSAFGGGGGGIGGAVFGGRGAAGFLAKATSYLAVIFMLNCGALAFMSASSDRVAAPGEQPTDVSSVVTQQAQAERDRALQQQQQQLLSDSTAPGVQVTPVNQTPQETPAETDGQ
jgi:preprotein translocase subunit SecG